jgi:hypothetical protein
MTGSACRPHLAVSAVLMTVAMTVAQVGVVPAAHAGTVAGSVSTVVRDAGTGQPAHACARLIPLDLDEYTQVHLGDDQNGRFVRCTGTQGGALVVDGVAPGLYQVFVETDIAVHGRQWVGWHGGTGQRHRARVIRVRSGTNNVLPDVRLDPPGSITGVVTDAAGAPVRAVDVAVVPYVPHPKYGDHVPMTDDKGRFTVTGLGPYNWPLQFSGFLIATQWSGGVANRLVARTARVRSGRTATLNQTLHTPTWISGSITVDEMPAYSQVIAFNASTGDIAGVVTVGDTYELPMLPGQVVKLRCDCAHAPSVWHSGQARFTDATRVRVGKAPIYIDFDLAPAAR